MRRRRLRRTRNVAWRIPSLTWDDIELEIRWVDALQELVDTRNNPHRIRYSVWSGNRCVHNTHSRVASTGRRMAGGHQANRRKVLHPVPGRMPPGGTSPQLIR